ncbi:aspartic peptidase domain-containing protein [Rhexocercosporidium sp. MPI-PUGE-AT-0058]|nr:aspartic peptidase domain-containing protein [Rhexocercosporidium sp. MPI-PUGE-AT-0058]
MVKSAFSATGACLVSALLASSAFAAPTEDRRPKNDDCKKILLPMTDSIHGPRMNITVGNPPQEMSLLSDWTWHTTWVHTPDCIGKHDVKTCIPPGQQYYDQAKSSTFKNTTLNRATFNGTDYTPGLPFTMRYGRDTMCFNSAANGDRKCMNDVYMGNTDFGFPLPQAFDIGGVFGFAPVPKGGNETFWPAPFQFFEGKVLNPVMGWHTCDQLKNKDSCFGFEHLTVLGGTDETVYKPRDMVYHDTILDECINSGEHLSLSPKRSNYWSSAWTGLSIDGKSFSLKATNSPNYNATTKNAKCDAIDPIAVWDEDKFGHGAPMPWDAFNYMVKVTNAKPLDVFNLPGTSPVNPGAGGLHEVPCDKINTFPTITYEISHKQKLTSVPAQYIDTTLHAGKCLLNARVWDRPVDGAQTFFGFNVLSRTYLEFDYKNNKVGLAPLDKKLFK